VLECLGLSFACGRAEVDGDVMVAQLVRFAFKAPAGAGRLHGRQLSSPYDVEIRFLACAGGVARAVCLDPRTSRSAKTCCARRRLVVRGGDLSEMQPFGQRLVVLPVRVLTKIGVPSLRHNTRWGVLSFWML
jgi:hypothetical protein